MKIYTWSSKSQRNQNSVPFHAYFTGMPEGKAESWPKADISVSMNKIKFYGEGNYQISEQFIMV